MDGDGGVCAEGEYWGRCWIAGRTKSKGSKRKGVRVGSRVAEQWGAVGATPFYIFARVAAAFVWVGLWR